MRKEYILNNGGSSSKILVITVGLWLKKMKTDGLIKTQRHSCCLEPLIHCIGLRGNHGTPRRGGQLEWGHSDKAPGNSCI